MMLSIQAVLKRLVLVFGGCLEPLCLMVCELNVRGFCLYASVLKRGRCA